ncbi:MAG: D-alanyl-D-alanine carboxypeptidase/D-alanyl-D-alanine-endopeptidase [Cyanobacteria bacterium J06641_5]
MGYGAIAKLLLGMGMGLGMGVEAAISLCPAALPARIESIVERPEWQRARWGIVVRELETGRTLYERDADRYFLPASTAKLFSTAAALTVLGPEFRWPTVIQRVGESFYLTGTGDPSLTTAELESLAEQLKAQRIQTVPRLAIASTKPPIVLPPTWEWEDVSAAYGVPASPIVLNENAVTLTLLPGATGGSPQLQWSDAIAARQWEPVISTVTTSPAGTPYAGTLSANLGQSGLQLHGTLAADNGPDRWDLAVPDPARYAAETLAQLLRARGISVGEIVTGIATPPTGAPIARVTSPPLAELLAATNQKSLNLHAETFLRDLALSDRTGLEVLEDTLTELGIDPDGYDLRDGSGLSRHNLLTPQAIAQLLQALSRGLHQKTYRASLAVAGESGTLERRFLGTPVAGKFQGKTGTLSGVTTLAGYLEPHRYQTLVTSILLNQSTEKQSVNRAAVDAIVELLAELEPCRS